MDDEDLFRRRMASLGVTPVDRRKRGKLKATEPARKTGGKGRTRRSRRAAPFEPDDDDALFLNSMRELAVAPDKDRSSPKPEPEMRRFKASKSRTVEPEAVLDLHGFTAGEARERLRSFVIEASARRLEAVVVVTGKGLRSERGVSVLKQTVEQWLGRHGNQWVRAFSEAPRTMGGRGAYVLYLR